MRVHVEYFAQAREATGRAGESVTLTDGATLVDLVLTLAAAHGPNLARLVLEPDGGLSRHILFTVGDAQAPPGAAVRLADGDRVTIVPPISGG
jgi:MoaD family protein